MLKLQLFFLKNFDTVSLRSSVSKTFSVLNILGKIVLDIFEASADNQKKFCMSELLKKLHFFISKCLTFLRQTIVEPHVFLISKCIVLARFGSPNNLYFRKLVTDDHIYKYFVSAFRGAMANTGNTLVHTAPGTPVSRTLQTYQNLKRATFQVEETAVV